MARLSEQLKKELYLESIRKRARHLYVYGESHPDEKDLIAHKLDGFLEAGLLLQIFNKDQLQQVIDEEHVTIFGMSRKERVKKRQQEGISPASADWSAYDAPATERVMQKRALSQWKQYLASEGAMSLEESFFGSETPSFAETTARYRSDRELFMKLLNAEAGGKERSDLYEMLQGSIDDAASECKLEEVLVAYDIWKKETNAGRVLRK